MISEKRFRIIVIVLLTGVVFEILILFLILAQQQHDAAERASYTMVDFSTSEVVETYVVATMTAKSFTATPTRNTR